MIEAFIIDQMRWLDDAPASSVAYEVTVHHERDRQSRTFVFWVETGDIEVVTWSKEFAAVLNGNIGRAERLLAAILSFHQRGDCRPEKPRRF